MMAIFFFHSEPDHYHEANVTFSTLCMKPLAQQLTFTKTFHRNCDVMITNTLNCAIMNISPSQSVFHCIMWQQWLRSHMVNLVTAQIQVQVLEASTCYIIRSLSLITSQVEKYFGQMSLTWCHNKCIYFLATKKVLKGVRCQIILIGR